MSKEFGKPERVPKKPTRIIDTVRDGVYRILWREQNEKLRIGSDKPVLSEPSETPAAVYETAYSKFLEGETQRELTRLSDVRRRVQTLREALEAIDESLDVFTEVAAFTVECDEKISLLEELIPTLQGDESSATQNTGVLAIISTKALAEHGDDLEARLDALRQDGDAGGLWERLKGLLKPIQGLINRILSGLWELVVGVFTLKEWTLKAELGFPLAAKGAIEIKFGPHEPNRSGKK